MRAREPGSAPTSPCPWARPAAAADVVGTLTTDDVTFELYDGPGSLHCGYDHAAFAVAALAECFADRRGVRDISHPVA